MEYSLSVPRVKDSYFQEILVLHHVASLKMGKKGGIKMKNLTDALNSLKQTLLSHLKENTLLKL